MIDAKYASSGGAAGWLGQARSDVNCGLRDGGCFRAYANGQIHWSSSSGAFATGGGIRSAWVRSGSENGPVGYPVSDERCGLPAQGCYQDFQSGKIYWSPATDARSVRSPILAGWARHSYERGFLGYPTEEMGCGLQGAGCYQDFQGGKIHWSGVTGAWATRGSILQAWAANGYERGSLGYPTGPEGCGLPGEGCYQEFQRGKVHWSAATGAHITKGAIGAAWARSGSERGALGYPTSAEECGLANAGCSQTFVYGTFFWSARTDARSVRGEILAEYQRLGGPAGKLGYPVQEQGCGLQGDGCYQDFQGGKIHWSAATGAHATWGGIQQAWAASGWERGPLGYPTGPEACGLAQQGCSQTYEKGTVYWTALTGAHAVSGALLTAYVGAGGHAGSWGYPVAPAICAPGGACSQQFQGGTLTP
ncbi:LGFP repeat-containing protein [Microbacterium sp. AK009]|uniref:LGFP repeat-containing protein n=1 Tax=Microbacterium sp. AK009 TaxID=2723068 RepID=UPI0035BC3638